MNGLRKPEGNIDEDATMDAAETNKKAAVGASSIFDFGHKLAAHWETLTGGAAASLSNERDPPACTNNENSRNEATFDQRQSPSTRNILGKSSILPLEDLRHDQKQLQLRPVCQTTSVASKALHKASENSAAPSADLDIATNGNVSDGIQEVTLQLCDDDNFDFLCATSADYLDVAGEEDDATPQQPPLLLEDSLFSDRTGTTATIPLLHQVDVPSDISDSEDQVQNQDNEESTFSSTVSKKLADKIYAAENEIDIVLANGSTRSQESMDESQFSRSSSISTKEDVQPPERHTERPSVSASPAQMGAASHTPASATNVGETKNKMGACEAIETGNEESDSEYRFPSFLPFSFSHSMPTSEGVLSSGISSSALPLESSTNTSRIYSRDSEGGDSSCLIMWSDTSDTNSASSNHRRAPFVSKDSHRTRISDSKSRDSISDLSLDSKHKQQIGHITVLQNILTSEALGLSLSSSHRLRCISPKLLLAKSDDRKLSEKILEVDEDVINGCDLSNSSESNILSDGSQVCSDESEILIESMNDQKDSCPPSPTSERSPTLKTDDATLFKPCAINGLTPVAATQGGIIAKKEAEPALISALIRKVESYDVHIIADKTRKQLLRRASALSIEKQRFMEAGVVEIDGEVSQSTSLGQGDKPMSPGNVSLFTMYSGSSCASSTVTSAGGESSRNSQRSCATENSSGDMPARISGLETDTEMANDGSNQTCDDINNGSSITEGVAENEDVEDSTWSIGDISECPNIAEAEEREGSRGSQDVRSSRRGSGMHGLRKLSNQTCGNISNCSIIAEGEMRVENDDMEDSPWSIGDISEPVSIAEVEESQHGWSSRRGSAMHTLRELTFFKRLSSLLLFQSQSDLSNDSVLREPLLPQAISSRSDVEEYQSELDEVASFSGPIGDDSVDLELGNMDSTQTRAAQYYRAIGICLDHRCCISRPVNVSGIVLLVSTMVLLVSIVVLAWLGLLKI